MKAPSQKTLWMNEGRRVAKFGESLPATLARYSGSKVRQWLKEGYEAEQASSEKLKQQRRAFVRGESKAGDKLVKAYELGLHKPGPDQPSAVAKAYQEIEASAPPGELAKALERMRKGLRKLEFSFRSNEQAAKVFLLLAGQQSPARELEMKIEQGFTIIRLQDTAEGIALARKTIEELS